MIYMIDEDVGQAEAWLADLKMRGFSTRIIRNADLAFEQLIVAENIDLVLIDIMLAVRDNHVQSRYSLEKTEDYIRTGLCLIDDLSQQRDKSFIERCVFLSNTGEQRLLKDIHAKAKELDIPFWKKFDFADPTEFSEAVQARIRKLEGARR